MAFPESFLQDLKMRNDITDVVSGYVNLKRRGRNMVGLCPFHGEKTPSFNVYTENGSFYCFGCGVGGDVISFIMKIENLDYVDAVKYLAQRAGLEMPENSYDDSMSRLRNRVFEANREAARFYYAALCSPQGRKGLDYFHSRALSDRTIRHFGLGYADDNWSSLCNHLKSKGFNDSELVAANLAVRHRNGNGIYDRFTDRVMFPIIDLRGNVIAFGGRIMSDAKPKYLNTSDTPVFKKSANLFSLNNAKNSGKRTLILCEGYMDVIAVNQAGFTNAVATLGTALTGEQAVLMKRYADEVIICYDADEAGQKATARAIPILRNSGLNVKVLTIPSGKDPDEFIKAKGAAEFSKLLVNAVHYISFEIACIQRKYNLKNPEHRVRFATEAAEILAKLDSEIERNVYLGEVSRVTGVEEEAIRSEIRKLVQKEDAAYQREAEKRQQNLKNYTPEGRRKDKGLLEAQRSLLYYAAQHQGIYDTLKEILEEDDFTEEIYWRTFGDIGDLWQNAGHVFPADLVSRFEDAKEQKQVTEIFAVQLPTENGADMEKAINEQVKRLKRTKIDHLTANAATVEEIQRLGEAKRKKARACF